jgi:hypothetical protein
MSSSNGGEIGAERLSQLTREFVEFLAPPNEIDGEYVCMQHVYRIQKLWR